MTYTENSKPYVTDIEPMFTTPDEETQAALARMVPERITPRHSLSVDELAVRWDYSSATIKRHMRAGTFPLVPLAPLVRKLRFSMVQVERHEAG